MIIQLNPVKWFLHKAAASTNSPVEAAVVDEVQVQEVSSPAKAAESVMGIAAITAGVFNGIQAAPYIVVGIQAIHGDAVSGADKKTLALEALGLAASTADSVLTGANKTDADEAAAVAGNLIDSIVGLFKFKGLYGFGKGMPAPAPAAV